MKGALANGPHVGSAECAVTPDRCIDAVTRAERSFAEVLAEVLRVDRLSVESHFFEELGADSLVMAKFCARVRKRGDLPSVSMKDVYQHCAEKHRHRYLSEFDFRYSNRMALDVHDGERADIAIKGAAGKRLTYRQPH